MNLNAKYDVFVSYSRKDYVDEQGRPIEGSAVSELLDFLDRNKIKYWFDKDGIYSGSEFVEVITNAITESKMLIFVSSIHSNASKWTTGEIFEALDQDKLIVPFKIDDSQYNMKFRMMVRPLDFIEYYSNPQLAFTSLLKAINICKEEYNQLLLEEQRRKEEEDVLKRKAEIENTINDEIADYQRYASNLDERAKQIVENQKLIGRTHKSCPVCNEKMPIDARFCTRCGWTFNPIFDTNIHKDKDHIFIMQSMWRSVNEADKEKAEARTAIATLEASLKEKEVVVEKTIQSLEHERNTLQKSLAETQQKLRVLETQNKESHQKQATFEQERKSLSNTIESLRSKLQERDKEIDSLKKLLADSQNACSSLTSELKRCKDKELREQQAKAEAERKAREERTRGVFQLGNVAFKMIPVEGGTFTMGATPEQGDHAFGDEKPAHRVTLSSYSIGETQVTQALWRSVMGTNPSRFKGDNLPVEQVSWGDCQEFIRKLNQITGKRFRLLTEAEWEYAARGGNKSRGYKYSGSNDIGSGAWYKDNSSKQTHPVATKLPNELGIYDMIGNVLEWCSDWYGDYNGSSQTNPTGPTSGSNRVLRGGSWLSSAWYCRVSYRSGTPSLSGYNIGFRLALSD